MECREGCGPTGLGQLDQGIAPFKQPTRFEWVGETRARAAGARATGPRYSILPENGRFVQIREESQPGRRWSIGLRRWGRTGQSRRLESVGRWQTRARRARQPGQRWHGHAGGGPCSPEGYTLSVKSPLAAGMRGVQRCLAAAAAFSASASLYIVSNSLGFCDLSRAA